MKELVSVIIPCYNDYKYINDAVDSINKQDYKNVEIIIIDDGSNLKTKEILKEIIQPNLIVITQNNSGPSVARNVGINEAKGEYILTLDADDTFEPSFLSKGVQVLNSNSKIGIVTCWCRVFNDIGVQDELKTTGGEISDLIFSNGILGTSLYRRECWKLIGGYDEKMKNGFEDWDFNIRLIEEGWDVYVINEYLFNYRLKENSREFVAKKKYKNELLYYLYIKHKELYIENYEELISRFLNKTNLLEKRNIALRLSIDYKIGRIILRPLRILNSIFK